MNSLDRRGFLKTASVMAAGLAMAGKVQADEKPTPPANKDKKVRVGVIGCGGRGSVHVVNMMALGGWIAIPALCDINLAAAKRNSDMLVGKGYPKPEEYTTGETAYEKMLDRGDLDAVIIATPWRWHVPMALHAMKNGIYPGIEVPCALTIEDCWRLVDTSEKTGVPCMMLENWSFRSDNLAVLRMAREGLFGEIVHTHCAHSHDCIDHWFFDAGTGADLWPAEYLLKYNRDQYPTHAVGPVLSWHDINCGDRFVSLASTATEERGIRAYFKRKFGPDHPGAKRKYAQGDIVTTVIRTAKGKSIVVNYDMQLPRPYDNRWMLQGTLGVYSEQRNALYLTGRSPQYHEWEPFAPYQEKYIHPWYKEGGLGGHGGVDGVMLRLFLDAVREKKPVPIDVYDSVTMSCIVALSGDSIAKGSAPVQAPDFTRGKWETRKPAFGLV